MKHLKTFESFYSEESINEEVSVKDIIKTTLQLPLYAFAFIILQFINPRKLKESMFPQLFDVYHNLDVLIDTLENIHFNNPDITDVESKKILAKINKLKEVKAKYPTLDDYKKQICKWTPFFNFKNRKYLKEQIMKYEPMKMSATNVLKEIGKVYSLVKREDIIGDVGALDNFNINYRNFNRN